MRLTTTEKILWSALYAGRYGREVAAGRGGVVGAVAAASAATAGLGHLHAAVKAKAIPAAAMPHVRDVLGLDEVER